MSVAETQPMVERQQGPYRVKVGPDEFLKEWVAFRNGGYKGPPPGHPTRPGKSPVKKQSWCLASCMAHNDNGCMCIPNTIIGILTQGLCCGIALWYEGYENKILYEIVKEQTAYNTWRTQSGR